MNISEVINRMTEIKREKKNLSNEYDKLQAVIQAETENYLANSKAKSVAYYDENGDEATVTLTDTVTVTAGELLKSIFGEVYTSMVEEKTTYTLKSSAKRILSSIWHGEYCEGSVEDVINSLDCDDKTKKVLTKKLKGIDFTKDKNNLINIAELSDEEASDTAYLINEVMAWNNMCTFIKLNNNGQINKEILDDIILKVNATVQKEVKVWRIQKGCTLSLQRVDL